MAQFGAELQIRETSEGFDLVGEVDAHTAPSLDEAISARLADHPTTTLDLSGVEFMDSSGVRVLIAATTASRNANGDLRLVSPSSMVRRLIEVSGLTAHFTVVGEH